MKIEDKKVEEIKNLVDTLKKIESFIGRLEIQKMDMFGQFKAVFSDKEEKVKESLLGLGIKEEDLPNYRINLEDGEVEDMREKKDENKS